MSVSGFCPKRFFCLPLSEAVGSNPHLLNYLVLNNLVKYGYLCVSLP